MSWFLFAILMPTLPVQPVVCFSGSFWWFSAGLCAEEEEGVAMQGSGEMALCRWNRIVIAQGKEEGERRRRRRIALCFGWWWFRPPFPRSPPLPSRLHPSSSSSKPNPPFPSSPHLRSSDAMWGWRRKGEKERADSAQEKRKVPVGHICGMSREKGEGP